MGLGAAASSSSLESCGVVFCVILAFIQPQVRVLAGESKGLLITGKPALPPEAVLNTSQTDLEALTVWGCACLRDGGGLEMCQLCESFQQGSPGAVQQPSLRDGDGRLAWVCLQLLPAPCQARSCAPAPGLC